MTAFDRVMERVNRNGNVADSDTPCPLLALEEFFEDNNVYGSIGCNLDPMPHPAELYNLFRRIRERDDVADVRVQVMTSEEPEEWPFSDTVWIITSASPQEVGAWMGDRFFADAELVGWDDPDTPPLEPYAVPEGMRPIGVWWD